MVVLNSVNWLPLPPPPAAALAAAAPVVVIVVVVVVVSDDDDDDTHRIYGMHLFLLTLLFSVPTQTTPRLPNHTEVQVHLFFHT